MKITNRITKVHSMVDGLIIENPHDARLKSFISIFVELDREFSKPEISKNKISDLSYALSRIYEESLDLEKKPIWRRSRVINAGFS